MLVESGLRMKSTILVNRMRASVVFFQVCRFGRRVHCVVTPDCLGNGTASLGTFPAPSDENRLVANSTLESRSGNAGARANRCTSKASTMSLAQVR